MQVMVFENGNMYMLKNRKHIGQQLTGFNTIGETVEEGKNGVKLLKLTEEILNQYGMCSMFYKLQHFISENFDEAYDGFIIEGIKVKPIMIRKDN